MRNHPVALRDALVGGMLGELSVHPDYRAAKCGDLHAAYRLLLDYFTDERVAAIRGYIGAARPTIVPVHAEEAGGRNKIPVTAAAVLACRLGLPAECRIVQATRSLRTDKGALDRVFTAIDFDGPVVAGREYLLLDDTLTQGGTMATLASFLRAGGGVVVGVVALTGKQYSRKLSISDTLREQLAARFGDLEKRFRRALGYGFDQLTESEARALLSFKPADAVRDRILAEGR